MYLLVNTNVGQVSCRPHIALIGLLMEVWNPFTFYFKKDQKISVIFQYSWYIAYISLIQCIWNGIQAHTVKGKEAVCHPKGMTLSCMLQNQQSSARKCNYCQLLGFEETSICLILRERCAWQLCLSCTVSTPCFVNLCIHVQCYESENKYPTEHIVKRHKCSTEALPQRAEPHCVCAIGSTMELAYCLTLRGCYRSMTGFITPSIPSEQSQWVYTSD